MVYVTIVLYDILRKSCKDDLKEETVSDDLKQRVPI